MASFDANRKILIRATTSVRTGSLGVLNLGRPSQIQRGVLDPREDRVRSIGSRSNGWKLRVPLRKMNLIRAVGVRSNDPESRILLQPAPFAKESPAFLIFNPRSTLSSKVFAVKSYFTRLDPCAFGFSCPQSMPRVFTC
jgi:hypothetical protein